MNKNKSKEGSRFVVLIGILGAVFIILLSIIAAGLIRGNAREPYDIQSMSYEFSRGHYTALMKDIYFDKSRKLTKIKSKDYYKYQGAAEYFRYAVIFYALDGEDETQAEFSAQAMEAGKTKMGELTFASEEMDAILIEALDRAENIKIN